MSKLVLILMAASSLCLLARAQETESLGEIARHARQQKQQATRPDNAANQQDPNAPAKPAQASHVITNDEIPEQVGSTAPASQPRGSNPVLPNYKEGKRPAEYWKSQILQLKNTMASLQRDIDRQNNSIHFADGNYEISVAACDQSATQFYDWLNKAARFTVNRQIATAGIIAPPVTLKSYTLRKKGT